MLPNATETKATLITLTLETVRRPAVKRDWRPPEKPRTSRHYAIGPRPDS